jgi:hypothetical protein
MRKTSDYMDSLRVSLKKKRSFLRHQKADPDGTQQNVCSRGRTSYRHARSRARRDKLQRRKVGLGLRRVDVLSPPVLSVSKLFQNTILLRSKWICSEKRGRESRTSWVKGLYSPARYMLTHGSCCLQRSLIHQRLSLRGDRSCSSCRYCVGRLCSELFLSREWRVSQMLP